MCNEFLFSLRACLDVWLLLLFKVFFIKKYIKIIYFLFFKKLFLISTHQNDLKTPKKY